MTQLFFSYESNTIENEVEKGKVCKSCKKRKPDSEFVKADGKHRATRNRCKVCHKSQAETRKRLREENPPPSPGNCQIKVPTGPHGYQTVQNFGANNFGFHPKS